MLMPIVSMNKMAMNESVAATCCYAERVSATNVYWEILHGGWVGSGYKAVSNAKVKNADAWADLFSSYDVDAPDYNDFPTIAKVTDADGVVGYEVMTLADGVLPAGVNGYTNLLGWLYDPASSFSVKRSCEHKADINCVYYSFDTKWTGNQHWDATSKHTTGGDGWAKPHDAKQWAS